MSKISIRFLKSGLIEVEPPNNFNEMSISEKREWADSILDEKTDEEILQAMSDFIDRVGFDSLMCEAIDNQEGESIIKSNLWEEYSENKIEWKKGTGELK